MPEPHSRGSLAVTVPAAGTRCLRCGEAQYRCASLDPNLAAEVVSTQVPLLAADGTDQMSSVLDQMASPFRYRTWCSRHHGARTLTRCHPSRSTPTLGPLVINQPPARRRPRGSKTANASRRCRARWGLDEGDARRRMVAQPEGVEQTVSAERLIDNSGHPDARAYRLTGLWDRLMSRPRPTARDRGYR